MQKPKATRIRYHADPPAPLDSCHPSASVAPGKDTAEGEQA